MKHLVSLFLLLIGLTASAQTIKNIYQNDGTVLQIPMSSIDSITYAVGNLGNLATLSTLPLGSITDTSAVSGGNITNGGGSPVTQRGVCWSTAPNPTTANSTTNEGSGVGNYASNLTGLVAGSTYYVRAYAINNAGTAYGNQVQFTAAGAGGGVVSNPGAGVTFDGYAYPSVVLGNGQEWMSENLRTTTYANGDTIPNVINGGTWWQLVTGAWAHYQNNSSFEIPYGKLYNWYAVADPRNVCPTGWHVPTDAEWNALVGYLDPSYVPTVNGTQSTTAGGKMKSMGTQYWNAPNTDATNESGFSGIPGGNRNASLLSSSFLNFGDAGYWWSATQTIGSHAWNRSLHYNYADILRNNNYKTCGYSVRCLRD